MDTLKLLLGATMALLVGALIVFVTRMNEGVTEAPEEEIAKLRKQVIEMEVEIQRLNTAREQRTWRDAVASTPPTTTSMIATPAPAQDDAALEAKLAEIEREREEALKAAELAELENTELTERFAENRDKLARRTNLINKAMLIATVEEWVENEDFGNFATIRIMRSESVSSGTKLALRRNGGILCKLTVSEIRPDGAIANPIGQIGPIKPEPGDELILAEILELAN